MSKGGSQDKRRQQRATSPRPEGAPAELPDLIIDRAGLPAGAALRAMRSRHLVCDNSHPCCFKILLRRLARRFAVHSALKKRIITYSLI